MFSDGETIRFTRSETKRPKVNPREPLGFEPGPLNQHYHVSEHFLKPGTLSFLRDSSRESWGFKFASRQTQDSWVGSANATTVLCRPPTNPDDKTQRRQDHE